MMELIVQHHLYKKKLESVLLYQQLDIRRGVACQTHLCTTYHDLAKVAGKDHITHAIDLKK